MIYFRKLWNKFKEYKKGAIFNVFLNLLATAIPVFALQLIILPYIANWMESDTYGLFISIISVLNLVPFTFGNSLNSIRMLRDLKYHDKNVIGDFNILVLISLIVSSIIVMISTIYYYFIIDIFSLPTIHFILTLFLSIIWLLNSYYNVGFLINLDYKAILKSNILLCIGYIIGTLLFIVTGFWELIYIIGYLLSSYYIFKYSDLWKEPLKKTILFSDTLKESVIYFIACLLYRVPTYADKLLLYPLLGGTFVSVYYVATLSGKIISMVISPITSVMLSYLSKSNDGRSNFKFIMVMGGSICVIGYFVCYALSRPILTMVYPNYVDTAMQYVSITTATTMIAVLLQLLNPFVLRNKAIKWQTVINIFTLVTYVVCTLGMFKLFGGIGFCIGCLIANICKFLFMLFIYLSDGSCSRTGVDIYENKNVKG